MKFGGTEKRGEKTMSVEEFLPIFSDAKKDKDQGCYEDFLECLKLYDKQENGTMLLAELSHLLVTLGECSSPLLIIINNILLFICILFIKLLLIYY